jgi:hypothetical protein
MIRPPSIAAVLLATSISPAAAFDYGTGSNPDDHYMSGYTRRDGTYVQPHHQTNPRSE